VGSRKIILVVAVVIGILAAVGLVGYTRSLKDDATASSEVVKVWEVEARIPKGTPISQVLSTNLIVEKSVPKEYAPDLAVKDPETELNGNLVAVSDLVPGEYVVQGNFVSERIAGSGLATLLPVRDLVTVTVSVPDVGNAGGLINPGDFVNVLSVVPLEDNWGDDNIPQLNEVSSESANEIITNSAINKLQSRYVPKELRDLIGIGLNAEVPEFSDLTPTQKALVVDWTEKNGDFIYLIEQLHQSSARYLLQNVEVLAIDRKLVADLGQVASAEVAPAAQGTTGAIVTLAVRPEDVQTVLNASSNNGSNGIYLSLVPDNYEPRPLSPHDPTGQVAPGEDVTRLITENEGSVLSLFEGSINVPESLASATSNPPVIENPAVPRGDGAADAPIDPEPTPEPEE